MINRPRRAAAAVLIILSILTATAASAAGFYYILVLLSEKNILGIILAAFVSAAIFAFLFSWILLGEGAAPKNKKG